MKTLNAEMLAKELTDGILAAGSQEDALKFAQDKLSALTPERRGRKPLFDYTVLQGYVNRAVPILAALGKKVNPSSVSDRAYRLMLVENPENENLPKVHHINSLIVKKYLVLPEAPVIAEEPPVTVVSEGISTVVNAPPEPKKNKKSKATATA